MSEVFQVISTLAPPLFKLENLEIAVFGSIKLSSLDTITETGVTVVMP